jgi:5-methylcytosine-specific restriction endonuclease McrA
MRAYQVVDETKLERVYSAGSESQLDLLLNDTALGYAESTKADIKDGYDRNRKLVHELHDLYKGRCQVTGHDSPVLYGVPTAEAHHMVYRSRGGADSLENMVLLSPNIHSSVHAADAKFDYGRLAFIFPNGRVEPVVLNEHLVRRSA